MSLKENKSIVRSFDERSTSEETLAVIDDLFAPDFCYIGPGGDVRQSAQRRADPRSQAIASGRADGGPREGANHGAGEHRLAQGTTARAAELAERGFGVLDVIPSGIGRPV